MTNIGTHRSHCCVLHGCKYGDADCPVKLWRTVQDHPCPYCDQVDDQALEVKVEYLDTGVDRWRSLSTRSWSSAASAIEFYTASVLGPMGEPSEHVRLVWRYVTSWESAQPPKGWEGFGEV